MFIRQKGNQNGREKSIAALIHHCSENDNHNDRQKYCPPTGDSWCKYQSDNINHTTTYKKSINIPKAISDIIIPIFSWKDLGSDSLLDRCFDVKQTRNADDSPNDVIWTKCRLPTGYFGFEGLAKTDTLRAKIMNIKASEKGRRQKKRLRVKRKGYQDKHAENEFKGRKVAENIRISGPQKLCMWKAQHFCLKNIFWFCRRHERDWYTTNGLRCIDYYGDGDSKGYDDHVKKYTRWCGVD